MTTTAYIALGLGFFFLFVAILNGFRARAERRRQADVRSAALHGGTPDAPVHLESPFSPRSPAPAPAPESAAPAPAAPAPAPGPESAAPARAHPAPAPAGAAAPPAAPAEEESYVWE